MQEQPLRFIFLKPADFQGTQQEYQDWVFEVATAIDNGENPDMRGIRPADIRNAMQYRFGGQ